MSPWIWLLGLGVFASLRSATLGLSSPFTWRCEDTDPDNIKCIKELYSGGTQNSLERCKLTCGTFGSLWPRPRTATLQTSVSYFLPENSEFSIQANPGISLLLREALNFTMKSLNMYHPNYTPDGGYWVGPWDADVVEHNLLITINVVGLEEFLALTTNESYTLSVSTVGNETSIFIDAPTFFGARHALETFSQLTDYDYEKNALQIVNVVDISDYPTYPYRGIALDTSRNFIPVVDLKRTLDSMAYNKLNTLHLHISDTHSFPLELETLPNMSYYGAYSPSKTYKASDIKALLQYARLRGVRLLPEFDAPAHVGSGWDMGTEQGLGNLVVCFKQEPWMNYCAEPPCGQLNIANANIYSVIGTLYRELLDLFAPLEIFHFGGDEVNLNCWNSSDEIKNWMISNGNTLTSDDFIKEWSIFQETVRSSLETENGGVAVPGIVWTSALTNPDHIEEYLSQENYIIQIWVAGNDNLIGSLLNKGYKVIFSNYDAWYLDCGFGSWLGEGNNWCSPYKGWKDVYNNSPYQIAASFSALNYTSQILGGEAILWTEQADCNSLDSRLWPRGFALAERLWLEPSTQWESAGFRFIHHRQRIVARGIKADAEQPEWCHQNDGTCYI